MSVKYTSFWHKKFNEITQKNEITTYNKQNLTFCCKRGIQLYVESPNYMILINTGKLLMTIRDNRIILLRHPQSTDQTRSMVSQRGCHHAQAPPRVRKQVGPVPGASSWWLTTTVQYRCCDTITDCSTSVQQIGESTNGKSAEIVINCQVKGNVSNIITMMFVVVHQYLFVFYFLPILLI